MALEENADVTIEDNVDNPNTSVSVNVEEILNPPPVDPEPTLNIPEKFQNEDGSVNQEALLKSYLELEKGTAPKEEPKVEPPVETEGFDLTPYYTKFDSGEEITAEEGTAIAEGMNIDEALVSQYVSLKTNERSQAMAQAEQDADTRIYNTVGGEEQYNKMIEWAGGNLTTEEHQILNMQLDNPVFAERGANLLKSLYESANGKEPTISVTPSAVDSTKISGDEFFSIEEVREAQRDPKYRAGDPRFHAEFDAKFARFKARQS